MKTNSEQESSNYGENQEDISELAEAAVVLSNFHTKMTMGLQKLSVISERVEKSITN